MSTIDLNDEDARLILNALHAYRHTATRKDERVDGDQITELSTRIIWRDTTHA